MKTLLFGDYSLQMVLIKLSDSKEIFAHVQLRQVPTSRLRTETSVGVLRERLVKVVNEKHPP